MESPWSNTGVFPGGGGGGATRSPLTKVPPSQLEQGWIRGHTHRFQAACGKHEISNGRADPDRNTHLSLSSETPKINIYGTK